MGTFLCKWHRFSLCSLLTLFLSDYFFIKDFPVLYRYICNVKCIELLYLSSNVDDAFYKSSVTFIRKDLECICIFFEHGTFLCQMKFWLYK